MKNKISPVSRALLIAAAAVLSLSLFVPVWSIYLDAPQYPEGLRLQIWANKISGDVDIINGLNHYIGMKTLHTKDFIEFTVLPYIIAAYAVLFLISAAIGKRKILYGAMAAFVVFGIVAMVDFWRWEYNYGHNLDPNAAIIVPGMAYQPPLIGFKQLLNFGAYSIPDIGGWLFVVAGVLLVIAIIIELRSIRKMKKGIPSALLLVAGLFIASCNNQGPQPLTLHKDACTFCKMSISDGKFGAELITTKGRIYKFDDLGCMFGYMASLEAESIGKIYVNDFQKNNELIEATTAWYIQNETLKSPMNGNIAAFATKEQALQYATQHDATVLSWNALSKTVHQPVSMQ